MIKYIVRPGYITPRTDGDQHYISASRLMQLHGIQPSECIIFRGPEDYHKLKGADKNLINVFPRADGKYKVY